MSLQGTLRCRPSFIELGSCIVRSLVVRRFGSKAQDNIAKKSSRSSTPRISKEFVTIFDIYRHAVTQFNKAQLSYGHTTLTPWEDAAFLIMHELALPYQDPITQWSSARLTENEKLHLLDLINQRITKQLPVAYLVKGCYYQGEYFYVDERALIPRSYLGEILHNSSIVTTRSSAQHSTSSSTVNMNIELDYNDYIGEVTDVAKATSPTTLSFLPTLATLPTIQANRIRKVLDLCTGSGCLAILAAKLFAQCTVDAVDISMDALAVAHINVHEVKQLDDRIELLQGDLFSAVKHKKYDLILCNPPYVSTTRMRSLPTEYRHEPKLALVAGQNGLQCIEKIILQSKEHLAEHGVLLLEIGATKEAFEKRFPGLMQREGARYVNTQHSQDEVVMLTKEALELVQ